MNETWMDYAEANKWVLTHREGYAPGMYWVSWNTPENWHLARFDGSWWWTDRNRLRFKDRPKHII
jgi:hypothetical protein